MESEEEKLPIIKWETVGKFNVYLFLMLVVCALLYYWIKPILPAFTERRERMEEIKPLRTEAKALLLTYEKALENPSAAIDKPVLWCVQNREEHAVSVGGAERKRLKVLNYPAMPLFLGSKHSACAEMLLVVTEISKTDTLPLITVKFMESFQ
ncbi:MAG: hypothetical protein A2X34_10260 [Elusimicrobia bacterium GWC2_51_8]|nr:MAG: hypothetical protein A2X33_01455 [Elusimicrobia bacterium GWA2_51_34]OGR61789.1 MAG: hypothetical protein A2X34_10260 [Elusimicrobia bacterium GWC2_51_8]OGR86386.1 MAG: hypothetical protein A2021_07220 [Elusimicrobia bacterium GWF2_52_66]HAF96194.1 hypothetical protein [Elusimicrobiota bacterium]HCE97805.1 hypothetical protein [Elusimicrobiota bacterium]